MRALDTRTLHSSLSLLHEILAVTVGMRLVRCALHFSEVSLLLLQFLDVRHSPSPVLITNAHTCALTASAALSIQLRH